MSGRKLWYVVAMLVVTTLLVAGCGGSGSGLSPLSQGGYTFTASGKVEGGKSVLKTLFAQAQDLGTVTVINAQDGTTLATGAIDANGSFSNLSITLPTAKAVLVFKADVSLAGSPFRTIVPIDLSNPPAPGISAQNSVTIQIGQQSTDIARTVSAMLGLSGILGDSGMTLASVNKTYAEAAKQVVENGGQILAYNTSGLELKGTVASASLLPVRDASTLTFDDLNNLALDGEIISAFIPNNRPVVNFIVRNKATGKGITGLRTFGLHVAKLVPESNGSNSMWLNYISSGLPQTAIPAASSAPSNPGSDAADRFNTTTGAKIADGYKVIDHGDGSYTVTFGADITQNANIPYEPTLTHRIAVTVRSVAVPGVVGKTPGAYAGPMNPRTGTNTANFNAPNVAALVYDFVPSTAEPLKDSNGKRIYARDNVTMAACNDCHHVLGLIGGHFASRPDTKVCVVCHTSQLKSASGPAGEGEFVTLIHRIHMGEHLPVKTGLGTLVSYGEQTYPQDIRNCEVCHKGADGANWKTKASRKACGSCHNDLDFANGTGHSVQTSDQNCTGCHSDASLLHFPVANPNPNNSLIVYDNFLKSVPNGTFSDYSAAYQANGRVAPGSPNSNTNASYVAATVNPARLPVGAKVISYDLKSVSRNDSKQPVAVFKFKMQTVQSDGTLSAATDVVFNDPAQKSEMIDGFVGSPSAYFVWAVPQDGITAPVDYNASAFVYLKRVWNGTIASIEGAAKAATLTGPDGSGYYTVTMTGVTVPDNAVMLTGGIGYTYGTGNAMTKVSGRYVPFATTTLPLTQIDLPQYPYTTVPGTGIGYGGLAIPPDNVFKVATGYTGRRLITDTARCNKCHGRLGVNPTYHAGQRNNAETCTFCHNVNRTNSGWAVNIKEDVHAIHAAAKRVNKFSWEVSAGAKYWEVTYPGVLRNCEQCHRPGMYDFSNSVYTANNNAIFDSMLYSTDASGTTPSSISYILTGTEAVPGTYYAPFVTAATAYGSTFSFNAATGVTTQAAGTTLVTSPIAAACFSCHDTKYARQHMEQFGAASIYLDRTTALTRKENCIVCHGIANNALNEAVPNIKAVHRWW